MSTIAKTKEILDDFEFLEDWEDKYSYIIDLGKSLESLEDEYKIDEFKVKGCMSQVWLVLTKEENDKLFFKADSDSILVRGLIALLLKMFSGADRKAIKNTDIESFFNIIGLKKYLSPNRSNGFFAMVEKIKSF